MIQKRRRQRQYQTEVSDKRVRNFLAAILLLAAVAIVVALIWYLQPTPRRELAFSEAYWNLGAHDNRFLNDYYQASQNLGPVVGSPRSKDAGGPRELRDRLRQNAEVAHDVVMVYLFGQFDLDDGQLVLTTNPDPTAEFAGRPERVPLLDLLADAANHGQNKDWVVLLDLGDGLHRRPDGGIFLDLLVDRLKQAPKNLVVIVSHDDGQRSLYSPHCKSTIFHAALRQVLYETADKKVSLAEFHRLLQQWVAGLTLDGNRSPMQWVPDPIVGGGVDPEDRKRDLIWYWPKDVLKPKQDFRAQVAEVVGPPIVQRPAADGKSGDAEPSPVLTLTADYFGQASRGQWTALASDFDQKFKNDQAWRQTAWLTQVAQLSATATLMQLAVDSGLVTSDTATQWQESRQALVARYQQNWRPRLTLGPSDEAPSRRLPPGPPMTEDNSLPLPWPPELQGPAANFENSVLDQIGRVLPRGPQSLGHAERMREWIFAARQLAAAGLLSSDFSDRLQQSWQTHDDDWKQLDRLPSSNSPPVDRPVAAAWRKNFRQAFSAVASRDDFPASLDPVFAWCWPSADDLIQNWDYRMPSQPPAQLTLKADSQVLALNIADQAQTLLTVEYTNASGAIELQATPPEADWQLLWEVLLAADAAEPTAGSDGDSSQANSPAPLSGSKFSFTVPPDQADGSFQVRLRLRLPPAANPAADAASPAAPLLLPIVAVARGLNQQRVDRPLELRLERLEPPRLKWLAQLVESGIQGSSRLMELRSGDMKLPHDPDNGSPLVLFSLPNLVAEYQFGLIVNGYAEQTASLYDGHLQARLEAISGDRAQVLARVAAVHFTGNDARDGIGKPLLWTWSEPVHWLPSTDLRLVVTSDTGRTVAEQRIRLSEPTPSVWEQLVKVNRFAVRTGEPFLSMGELSLDPQQNWAGYANEELLSRLPPEFQKRVTPMAENGQMVEFRLWSSDPESAPDLQLDGQQYQAISAQGLALPFDRSSQPSPVYFFTDLYGWPQVKRFLMAGPIADEDPELLGVFVRAENDCQFVSASRGNQKLDNGEGMWIPHVDEGEYFFFLTRPEANRTAGRLRLEFETSGRVPAINARWWLHRRPRPLESQANYELKQVWSDRGTRTLQPRFPDSGKTRFYLLGGEDSPRLPLASFHVPPLEHNLLENSATARELTFELVDGRGESIAEFELRMRPAEDQ